MAEEHESVDEVRADKAGTTGDENALSLRVGQEPDRRELVHGRVLDRVGVLEVGRLGAVGLLVLVGILGALLDIRGRLGGVSARTRGHETSRNDPIALDQTTPSLTR